MKVIAFNGSPHKNGVINKGIETIAAELAAKGIETECVQVGGAAIHGCAACGTCRKTGRCVFNDDMVNGSIDKANEADGVILGSPTYYGGIAGAFKCFLDRLFYAGVKLAFKPAVVVASLRRSGGMAVTQQLSNYLNLAGAVIVPNVYWPVIHGNTAEEVLKDGEGMYVMQTAGRNMAWLLAALEAGKKAVPLPPTVPRVWTNFVRGE
jgi:multimeric flavodoxin WrbA